MIRIAVCDDVLEDRKQLADCLNIFFLNGSRTCSALEYKSGENLIFELEEKPDFFDLIFLDIFMDEMSGMDAAKAVRKMNQNVPIVFTTTSPDFAIESYDVEAFGYLLKPISQDRINVVMKKYCQKYEDNSKFFVLKKSGYVEKIPYDQILYFESKGNKVILYSKDGKVTDFYDKLDHVQQSLDSKSFLRCHQSYLVNMPHIYSAGDDFVLKDGKRVPIKVRERKALRDTYFQFIIAEGGNHSL